MTGYLAVDRSAYVVIDLQKAASAAADTLASANFRPSDVERQDCEIVAAYLHRRARGITLESTAAQGLEALPECQKSLAHRFRAFLCAKA